MDPFTLLLNLLSFGATVAGVAGQAKTQKKITEQQQQQQKLQVQQQRRQAIRQAQLQRAQASVAAQAYGAGGGSAISGGLSSLGSQIGGQLGFSSQMSGISRNITALQGDYAKWGAIGELGAIGFQTFGGSNTFMTAFDPETWKKQDE